MAEAAFRPIAALAHELAEGKTTSRRLVEAALARIADAGGEGGRVFTKVHAQSALVAADASDRLRKQGVVPSPVAGLPVSIKDLFDIAGEVTTAGSKGLRDAAPAAADAVAAARLRPLAAAEFPGLRLGGPKNHMLQDLDVEVAQAFDAAMQRLSRRGAVIVPLAVPEFDEAAKASSGGGISPPEAYAVHRKWIDREQEIDPRVLERILRGGSVLAADYIDLLATRNRLVARFTRANYDIDVLVMPTVPRIAPLIAGLARNPETFRLSNGNMLRNTSLINFLDGCALTLPIHAPREAPVGLMVVGFSGEDERVLSAGLAIEGALAYQGPVLVQ